MEFNIAIFGIIGLGILVLMAAVLIIAGRKRKNDDHEDVPDDQDTLDALEEQLRVLRELIVDNDSGVEPLVEAHLTGADDTQAMKDFSAQFSTAADRERGLERYNERFAEQQTTEYRTMLDEEFPNVLRAGILDLREHTPEFSVMITNPTESGRRDTFLLDEAMAHDVYHEMLAEEK